MNFDLESNNKKNISKQPIKKISNKDLVSDSEIVGAINEEKDSETRFCSCGRHPGEICGCSLGKGCNSKDASNSKNCGDCTNQSRCMCAKGAHKLEVFDWLCDFPEAQQESNMIEVQFKNTRKGYYLNSNNLDLYKGDIVAVEAVPGHDLGEVTLTGKLVLLQMKKNNYRALPGEQKRVYRIAKAIDLEKYKEAKSLEYETMLSARQIAEEMNLNMKISDVEYQGDGNKAIFYYIADERVDFRQLIKVYAERFHVKIEMKQIGARQEAGRVGGIGPCGRELCCSSSMSNFVSVSTSAARLQDISLNPQKLAGQCGKLKCCLNYEVDIYVEAQRKLPSKEIVLETKDASFYHFKTDILSGMMSYSTAKGIPANLVTITKDRAFDIIQMNKHGKRPLDLVSEDESQSENVVSKDILEQDNITRFDSNGNSKSRGKKKINKRANSRTEVKGDSNSNNQNRSIKKANQQNSERYISSVPLNRDSENETKNHHQENKKKFHKKRPPRTNNDTKNNA